MEWRRAQLECFRFEELSKDEDLSHVAQRAFGREGLGIAAVVSVPDIGELRRDLFLCGYRFATLPKTAKARYEHPGSTYSVGWSHGKEMLEAGRPDVAKGSFYANPCHDAPFDGDTEALALRPALATPNVWPDAEVPGFSVCFKSLGQAIVRVGTLVGRQCDRYVSKQNDAYEDGRLERIVSSSRCCKGRLLHYFAREANDAVADNKRRSRNNESAGGGHSAHGVGPAHCLAASATANLERSGCTLAPSDAATSAVVSQDEDEQGTACASPSRARVAAGDADEIGVSVDSEGSIGEAEAEAETDAGRRQGLVGTAADPDGSFSDWCGWHNDHGSLTGLVPAMFLDAEGKEVRTSDPSCGLFIRSRRGVLIKVTLPDGVDPSSCLLFQIGETAQVHSGGVLQATPHAVRSTSQAGVSREAFAVFMQPEWDEPMDVPGNNEMESARSLHSERLLPRRAVPIEQRLRPGMDFGAFVDATMNAFY